MFTYFTPGFQFLHQVLNIQDFSRPFHSIIQGPSSSQSFYSIQPYWYSRKKRHANLRHSCMTVNKKGHRNEVNKTTRSDINFLHASIGGMFHDRQIPNFSRQTIQNNLRELFQCCEIQRHFKASLEFKASAGNPVTHVITSYIIPSLSQETPLLMSSHPNVSKSGNRVTHVITSYIIPSLSQEIVLLMSSHHTVSESGNPVTHVITS